MTQQQLIKFIEKTYGYKKDNPNFSALSFVRLANPESINLSFKLKIAGITYLCAMFAQPITPILTIFIFYKNHGRDKATCLNVKKVVKSNKIMNLC